MRISGTEPLVKVHVVKNMKSDAEEGDGHISKQKEKIYNILRISKWCKMSQMKQQ